jgi:hypothetical protein
MDKKTTILLIVGLGIVAGAYYLYNQASTPPVTPTLGNLASLPETGSLGGEFMLGWDATINTLFGTHYGQQ